MVTDIIINQAEWQAKVSSLVASIAASMTQQQLRLGLAESCTGGGLAFQCTSIPGSSAWFERGLVTYSNAAKQELLAVKAETLAEHGAVSEAVACEMAQGVMQQTAEHIDITMAITGVAGPEGGSIDKPVGTVCFALLNTDQCTAYTEQFSGDRATVRAQAILFALNKLYDLL